MRIERQRKRLLERELRLLGIRDDAVLDAMRVVPREAFVAEALRDQAYRNAPLPIGAGQTISQPFIVAHMAEALELDPGERVLEIGAGSGYAAAVLSRLAARVFTVERNRSLADAAAERLARLGYDNVRVRCADGTLGWPEEAPFDAIVVAAGSPGVPPALLAQLRVGGRLVIPVGDTRDAQELLRIVRRGEDAYATEDLGAVRFVPLIGAAGWRADDDAERVDPPELSGAEPREEAPDDPWLDGLSDHALWP